MDSHASRSISNSNEVVEKKRKIVSGHKFENEERTVRLSTKTKTIEGELARKQAVVIKKIVRPPIKHIFTQKELLIDALLTEVINNLFLLFQFYADLLTFLIVVGVKCEVATCPENGRGGARSCREESSQEG